MKPAVLTEHAQKRIQAIHRLSKQYNENADRSHEDKLLELMRKHMDEIEELARKGDQHFLTETGDLAVLCFELLLEHEKGLDETLSHCFERYENKLYGLLKGQA